MRTIRRPLALSLLAFAAAASLYAIQPDEEAAPSRLARAYLAPELAVEPTLDELGDLRTAPRPELAAFVRDFGSEWIVRWDRRSARPHLIQGSGVAIVPGRGNGLLPADLGLAAGQPTTLEAVAARLRGFLAAYPELLGVEGLDLRLDPARSTAFGAGNSKWFVELAQYQNGVPVEGANVFFRLSHGNLVQFGADRVSPVAIDTQPALNRETAFAAALRELQFPAPAGLETVVDAGSLHLYPTVTEGEASGERFAGAAGSGYSHLLAWKFVFRVAGESTTYQVLFDAHRNQVLEVRDLNATVDATVSGGIYPTTNTDPETVVTFPFATVTNGGTTSTNAAGIYNYAGGTATVTLNGQYFRMLDACGSISLADSTTGNLAFGTSGGTDCTTPGVGGTGNTHASRSGFYHLTRINRKADTFFPANAWIDSKVTANMNINQTCNAFWNGSTLNFYRSGGGCSNTGELAAVFLHEWGHGMDSNTGGSASENGSGEAVGDTFAFLETRDGCIGQNFQPASNCHNCTSCTGVRDVSDFDLSGPALIAKPANVTSNAGLNCDRFACPYLQQGIFPYQGPMGYEGHCESVISSAANWDLTQMLVAEYGTDPGWAAMDEIWYGSLTPSKSGYRLVSGGKCNIAAVLDGCGATNWYTVYLPVDDDDGNLANGTPNGCRIWDAFSAHGIACGARPACHSACASPATADAGPDAAVCLGDSTAIGTPALPSHSYLWSPGGATTAQILVSPASTTLYTVTATTSCDDAVDSVEVVVNVPPAAPLLVGPPDGAITDPPVVLSWASSPGATSYLVEVATDAGFTGIVGSASGAATSANFGALPVGSYFWRVTASGGCGSSPASAVRTFTVDNVIFVDGFGSADTSLWSLAFP
jgi:Zn-dependent metalloprotease